ncbi:MAG TPA: hypothetical protein V6D29_16200 [Leptolyngbyaceae cyanobacterium]
MRLPFEKENSAATSSSSFAQPTGYRNLEFAAPVTEDHVLAAIVGVIQAARQNGQSIEEVQAAVLADDALLEQPVRELLKDIVTEAWNRLR